MRTISTMAEGDPGPSRAEVLRSVADSDDESEASSQSSESWLVTQPLLEEEYFPRIVAIFYSIFHPTQGPTVVYQVPEGSIASSKADPSTVKDDKEADDDEVETASLEGDVKERRDSTLSKEDGDEHDDVRDNLASQGNTRRLATPIFDFKTLSEYIIPKAALCGRLMSCSIPASETATQRGQSYKILSHPVILYDQAKYPRNSFLFNLAFVFDGRADTRPYEPIVRKCARELTNMEQASSFLSKSQFRMYEVIEQLFEDLNSYYESFVAIPDAPHSKYVTKGAANDAASRREPSDATRNWADLLRKHHTASNADARLHREGYSTTRSSHSSHASNRPGHFLLDASMEMSSYQDMTGRRPPTKRASTEAPAVDSTSLQTRVARANSKDSTDDADNSSDNARPGINRAKTLAALGLSETTVGTSAGSVTSPISQSGSSSPPLTSPPLLDRRRSSAASLSLSAAGGTLLRSMSSDTKASGNTPQGKRGEDGVAQPILEVQELSGSVLSQHSDNASNLDPHSMRKTEQNANSNGIGAAATVSLLSPGKREPPHGLGRTVRDAINVKLFPTHANPPEVHDWDVPVTLLDLKSRLSDNWDLTMIRVLPLINGINHVKRIAQLADADLELTRQCIEHLLYYRCIIVIDTFQFTNLYTVRPTIALLAEDDVVISECASYVTKQGYQMPSWPKLLRLYSSLRPSLTLSDWIDDNDVDELGVDVRRFITFGVIKGFLRRVHRYPVLLSPILGDESAITTRDDSASRSRSRDRLATLRNSEGPNRQQSGAPRERNPSIATESPTIVWDTSIRSGATPKGSTRRRYGIQLAQGQAHHHRQTQATVMDAAHVAYDAARGFADADARRRDGSVPSYAYSGDSMGTAQPPMRTPLTRNTSSSNTIRAGLSKRPSSRAIAGLNEADSVRGIPVGGSASTSGRFNSRHARRGSLDGQASSKAGQVQPIQIPPELVSMLDGMHPDDAFSVRFGKSWNEIVRMLHIIGHANSLRGFPGFSGQSRAGTSGFSTIRGRTSLSEEAGVSGFAGMPATDDAAGESTFYKLSGIWGVEGGGGTSGILQSNDGTPRGSQRRSIPAEEKMPAQPRSSRAPATPTATVTFPSLPRYRANANENSTPAQQSNHSSFSRRGVGSGPSQGRENSGRQDSWLFGPGSGSTDYAEKSGGQDEGVAFDRRRSAQGNLGRVQIIVK